jgi:hypothetical protein
MNGSTSPIMVLASATAATVWPIEQTPTKPLVRASGDSLRDSKK